MPRDIVREITERGPKPLAPNARLVHHWFWKAVPVDPLIFSSPQHDGSAIQIARQVYHRVIGRMVSDNAHAMQLALLVLAWLLTFLIGPRFAFRGGDTVGFLLGLAVFGGFLFAAVPLLMRLACPGSAEREAEAIVRRTFLRDLPTNTPDDLRDELQQGWLTADGRPLSSEISAEDGRTLEATRRSAWWVVTAFALAWAVSYLFVSPDGSAVSSGDFDDVPFGPGFGATSGLVGGLGLFEALGSLMVLLILVIKVVFDTRPLRLRALELEMAAAVEGTAFVTAGGDAWGTIAEAARQRQIREAAADSSPIVELGETTGVFGGRNDFFGPRAGLPFRLSLRDLQMHMLVLGGTGSGKTSGILRPLARQLSAFDRVGLVVMDGKGSLPAELAQLAGMRLVDPADTGTQISLVSGVEPAILVDTIRETLAGGTDGGENQFWVNSAASVLRRGAVIAQAAGGAWWSLFHAVQLVSRKEERDGVIDALLPRTDQDPLLREACMYFRAEWDTMDERTRSNILAVIRSWLSTITATPELLRWARTPAGSDTLDILAPLTGGRLGVLIPEHRYGAAGAVVTALLKARLYNGLKARADRDWSGTAETPVVFIVDEAQEVATSQDAQMLAIGRSLGLAMIAATQGLEGVTAKLGERTSEKWLAIFGSVVALGGRSIETDTFVSRRAGDVWQLTPTDMEGTTVRGGLSMEAMSGPAAAARTQPHMNRTAARWRLAAPNAVTGALAALPLFGRGAVPSKKDTTRLALGARPLVVPGEIASLTAVPDTAIVLATRGRVARRDVVRLRPEYVTRSSGAGVTASAAAARPAPTPAAVTAAATPQSYAVPTAGAASGAPRAAGTRAPAHEPAAPVATTEPGAPARCASCGTEITDRSRTTCASCGARI